MKNIDTNKSIRTRRKSFIRLYDSNIDFANTFRDKDNRIPSLAKVAETIHAFRP